MFSVWLYQQAKWSEKSHEIFDYLKYKTDILYWYNVVAFGATVRNILLDEIRGYRGGTEKARAHKGGFSSESESP